MPPREECLSYDPIPRRGEWGLNQDYSVPVGVLTGRAESLEEVEPVSLWILVLVTGQGEEQTV